MRSGVSFITVGWGLTPVVLMKFDRIIFDIVGADIVPPLMQNYI